MVSPTVSETFWPFVSAIASLDFEDQDAGDLAAAVWGAPERVALFRALGIDDGCTATVIALDVDTFPEKTRRLCSSRPVAWPSGVRDACSCCVPLISGGGRQVLVFEDPETLFFGTAELCQGCGDFDTADELRKCIWAIRLVLDHDERSEALVERSQMRSVSIA